MNFSERIEPYFPEQSMRKGQSYYQEKRLKDVIFQETAAIGLVLGSSLYKCSMEFTLSGRKPIRAYVEMDCECPQFAKGILCKHLWVLVLAADKEAWGNDLVKAQKIELEMGSQWDDEFENEDDDEFEDYDEFDEPLSKHKAHLGYRSPLIHSRGSSPSRSQQSRKPTSVPWDEFKKRLLPGLDTLRAEEWHISQTESVKSRVLLYAFDPTVQLEGGDLTLWFHYREFLQTGKLGVLKPTSLRTGLDRHYADPIDRELFETLIRECDGFRQNSYSFRSKGVGLTNRREAMQGILLQPVQAMRILRLLADHDKLIICDTSAYRSALQILRVSETPWHLEAEITDHDASHYKLGAGFIQGTVAVGAEGLELIAEGRYVLHQNVLSPCTLWERRHQDWMTQLNRPVPVLISKSSSDAFVADYSLIPFAPPIRWPKDFQWTEEGVSPHPRLRLKYDYSPSRATLLGEIIFQYPQEDVNSLNSVPSWVDPVSKKITLRDFSAERSLLDQIFRLPAVEPLFDPDLRDEGLSLRLDAKDISSVVDQLENSGWDIDVEGKRIRVLQDFEIVVEGEIDWFDLSVKTTLDSTSYQVPELLRKRPKGEIFIPLGNNELALLPEVWLKRFEVLQSSGKLHGDSFRVPSSKVLLLDNLLSEMPIENRSLRLGSLRDRIHNFRALEPALPPQEFQGTLREYQKEGLAWLEFLRDFGFGGCLADEMGLGKTIQVLALLLGYHLKDRRHPSLVVVPRSLVGNWVSEAEKFCPALKVIDCSGSVRNWPAALKERPDVIVITYGTLRQDIKDLSKLQFAYAILDESQTIKNQSSQAAKAAYLIKAHHRLAMSGTPIENHMGELMSLMAFLNPGLMDGPHWKELFKKKFDPSNPHIKNLLAAIRPLMLRRTKALVLKDLPQKIEDTLHCDLEGEQKKHYEELRIHYQMNLLPELHDDSWRKSSIVVIEALLRLRQAACHSGLVDERFHNTPSAKLEVLMEKLHEIRESGHKALIFSQFTSFLKIVSDKLTAEGVAFEYLDGKTRNRSERVTRFQNDPKIPVFLISLKAGGVGLNLTAADYCFILDPWWNPAAEAQAIDRAHRINQKNTVFAYRIIARGTVEEKIQALQADKRQMMEAVLDGEGTLLKELDLKTIQSLFN